MTAYAVANLRNVQMGEDILGYLKGIDATLEPFGGRYIVHGGEKTVLEGDWIGDLIILAFPDREQALAWYASPAYRRLLPLRSANAEGEVVVVEGVPEGHRATDILEG